MYLPVLNTLNFGEKVDETLLTEKEGSYRNLNVENITDADTAHKKRGCNFKKLMKGSDCVFDCIHLLHMCHKIKVVDHI